MRRRQIVGALSEEQIAIMVHDQVDPCLQISIQRYAVLFNLDVSGSMQGSKWRSVCGSVDNFVSHLG